MSSLTPRQHRAMEAAAHGRGKLGIPQSVGQDFVDADKGKTMGLSKDAKVGAVKGVMKDLMGAMGSMSPDRARKKKPPKKMPAVAKKGPPMRGGVSDTDADGM